MAAVGSLLKKAGYEIKLTPSFLCQQCVRSFLQTQVAVDELSRNSQLLPLSYKSVRDLRNVMFCSLYMWTCTRVKSTRRNITQLEAQLAPLCRLFAYWIFLVEVWPYRCSWILHHVGVMEERALGSAGNVAPSQRLTGQGETAGWQLRGRCRWQLILSRHACAWRQCLRPPSVAGAVLFVL